MQNFDRTNDSDLKRFNSKCKRRERYEFKLRYEHNLYYGADGERFSDEAAYTLWKQEEQRKKAYQALYQALDELKKIDPVGYKLIIDYYFHTNRGKRFTTKKLGKRYGISQQACSYRIHSCLKKLKALVMLNK